MALPWLHCTQGCKADHQHKSGRSIDGTAMAALYSRLQSRPPTQKWAINRWHCHGCIVLKAAKPTTNTKMGDSPQAARSPEEPPYVSGHHDRVILGHG